MAQCYWGMPETELPGILMIMYNVVEDQQADRKFDSQTMKPAGTQSCRANEKNDSRSDNADVININPNMPDDFRSSTKRQTRRPSD